MKNIFKKKSFNYASVFILILLCILFFLKLYSINNSNMVSTETNSQIEVNANDYLQKSELVPGASENSGEELQASSEQGSNSNDYENEGKDAESALEDNSHKNEPKEQTYIEKYGLKNVDKPQKRTKEEVISKLAELAQEYQLVREVYENHDLYSDDMLENLANNPEMAAYVLGTIQSDGSVTGGFSDYELKTSFPLLLQFDPRWGYYNYGGKEMGITGCGPTCLSMAILALTDLQDYTPDKIAEFSMCNGFYVDDIGTSWTLLDAFPASCGLTTSHPSIDEASMKASIDSGKVLICSVKAGEFTSGGHFILVYGYNDEGFLINDPKCVARSNKTWSFAEFGNQIKRIWAIGNK